MRLLAPLLFLPLLAACSTPPPPTPPVAVRTAAVTVGSVAESATLSGQLVPDRSVTVAALAAGRLTAVSAAVGDRVTAGQTLARVAADHPAVAAENVASQLAAARARRAQLDAEFAAKLTTAHAARETAADLGRSQIAAAEAALAAAESGRTTGQTAALTAAAATLTQTADLLDQLLGVSPANETANDSFERYLGALDGNQKTRATESVRQFLPLAQAYRAQFDSEILPGTPTAAQLASAAGSAETALLAAKNALAETHTLLLKTVSASDYPASQIETQKQAVLTLGSETEKVLTALRTARSADGTSGDVAVLTKKLTEAETAASSANRLAERQVNDLKAARESALAAADAEIVAIAGGQKTAAVNLTDFAATSGIAGRVTEKLAEVGQVVAAGQPLFTVASETELKVVAAAPPTVAPLLAVGQAVAVAAEGQPERSGRITKITPTADPATGNLPIEIAVAASGLRPGLFASVTVKLPRLPGLVVPRAAVIARYGRTVVFVVAGGRVATRDVVLGAENGGFVVATSGLSAGEKVVVEGADWLREGDAVTVTP